MMGNFTKKRMIVFLCMAGILSVISVGAGCANDKKSNTEISGTEENGQKSNGIENKTENVDFSVEKYQKSITDGRVSLKDYADQYEQETQELQNLTYRNVSFSDCTFETFPDKATTLSVFYTTYNQMTAQECWDMIDDWLVDIGKRSEVDMDAEVRATVKVDQSKEYPDCWPLMKEYLQDEAFDAGAFVDRNDCYVLVSCTEGITQMSDGKIRNYLQTDEDAYNDITIGNTLDLIQEGKVSKLKDASYALIDGERTIGESADQAKTYFETGVLQPKVEGVTLDVPEVRVFSMDKDTYSYEFSIRDWYENMPFLYQNCKEDVAISNTYDGYLIEYPRKRSYVVDSEGISTFLGDGEVDQIHVLYQDSDMVGIKQAVDIMSQKLASFLKLEVHDVGIGYAKYHSDLENKQSIYYPFWKFRGVNKMKNQELIVYVDMISGAVYYTFE